ncbi:MAG: IS30 family transposase [Chlorobi bacterium]|nr:IS30 family transposase [Chlorobiota bacterium]
MEKKRYTRLTLPERVRIETLLGEKRSKSYIAKKLGRSRSTIGNEVNRWLGTRFSYTATVAHEYTRLLNGTKRDKDKITLNKALRVQVYRGLLERLSPELISGRLKLVYPNDPTMQISHESIYRYIYSHPQGNINRKLIKLLVRKKPRRGKLKKSDRHQARIRDGTSIECRPAVVEQRTEVGHWEGDLVIGARHNSCIGTIVERKSRYLLIVKPNDKKSRTVCVSFAKKLNEQPSLFKKPMTYDNGTEMAEHKLITKKTGMDIYFAHPCSSWERGTNENTNGLIRRYYPKKTDFNTVSQEDLDILQEQLNNRPRKVLGYHTARETYQFELNKFENDIVDVGVYDKLHHAADLIFSWTMPHSLLLYIVLRFVSCCRPSMAHLCPESFNLC